MGRQAREQLAQSTRTRKQLHGKRSAVTALVEHFRDAETTRKGYLASGEELDSTDASAIEPGSNAAGTRPFICSGRLVAVQTASKTPDTPINERRREDRDVVLKLQDKLTITSKHTYVQKVLRAHDPENKGALTPDAMHAALGRLNLGLSDLEISQVVSRLRTPGSDLIPCQSLFNWAHSLEPLGVRQMDDGLPASHGGSPVRARKLAGTGRLLATSIHPRPSNAPISGTGEQGLLHAQEAALAESARRAADEEAPPHSQANNSRTRAPWEPLQGRMQAWNWELRPQGLAGVVGPAEPGSYEQKKQDALLISLLSERLNQSADKLRATFRKWDASRNGQLSKDEFVGALEAMHLNVPRPQLERLFDMADVNGSAEVDYLEFVRTFESRADAARRVNPADQAARQVPLAQTLDPPLAEEEVREVVRSQLAQELASKLAAKATAAHAVFRAFDANGDGHLSLQELTTCCQALTPGISERQVAALLTAADPSGDGYLTYREFLGNLVDSAPPHPRLTNAHMAGPAASRMGEPRNGWGHSPLFTRYLKPAVMTAESDAQARREELQAALGLDQPLPPSSHAALRTPHARAGQDDGAFSNTVWSREDLPTPGYTGVLQPHLRGTGRPRMSAEERRLMLHKMAVEPLLTSLSSPPADLSVTVQLHADATGSGKQPHDYATVPSTPLPAPGRSKGPDGLPPYGVKGSSGVTERRGKGSVLPYERSTLAHSQSLHGERTTAAASSGLDTPPSSRRQRREVTDTSALRDLIPPRWGNDPEYLELRRSLPDMHGGRAMTPGAPATTSHSLELGPRPFTTSADSQGATARRTKGKARFPWMTGVDTAHVTRALPGCSQWADPADTWVRKSDAAFLSYKEHDRQRKATRAAVATQRHTERLAETEAKDALRLAKEEAESSALIHAKGMVKARYVERCAMYDEARAAHVPHSTPILNRSLFFTDHVLIDPVLVRAGAQS